MSDLQSKIHTPEGSSTGQPRGLQSAPTTDAETDFDAAEDFSVDDTEQDVQTVVDSVAVAQSLDEKTIATMIAEAVAGVVSEEVSVQEAFKRRYIPLATTTLTICGFKQLAVAQAIARIADLPAPVRMLLMAGVLVVGAGLCARMAQQELSSQSDGEQEVIADAG